MADIWKFKLYYLLLQYYLQHMHSTVSIITAESFIWYRSAYLLSAEIESVSRYTAN